MPASSRNREMDLTFNRSTDRQQSHGKNGTRSDSIELPKIIRNRATTIDSIYASSMHSDEDGMPYPLQKPLLTDKDLEIDYEHWKKRTCCHQFSNENLEKHFWEFYMNNHTMTIRVVLITIFFFAIMGWMVVDYVELNEENLDVFWHLFYLRLLWSLIILVFLLFFQIGINWRKDPKDADLQMNVSRASNSGSFLHNPVHYEWKETEEVVDGVDETLVSNDRPSWWSRMGELTVKYSFRSVFTVCFLISLISILISYIGNRPSHKPYIMWFILIHIFCGLGNKASSCLCWLTAIMFIIINVLLDHPKDDKPFKRCAYVVCISINLSVMGEFLEFSYRKLFYKRGELELEQYNNDVMLTNVVPPRIAYQLQRGEREAVSYDYKEPNWGASVLFCQICDFEELSNKLPASALVNYLNKVFTKIDRLSSRHKVYKVETVKEVYMAASGLPQPDADHMNQIAHFALDIKECLIDNPKSLTIDYQPEMEAPTLKIGINCGTVIAGVIGNLCPRYRLFGDTVNVAARMETNSLRGKIQITKEFNKRINSDIFITEERGTIEIKGKNKMFTFFLISRKQGGSLHLNEQFVELSHIPTDATNTENAHRMSTFLNAGISMVEFCQQAGMIAQRKPSEKPDNVEILAAF